jgi:hypothetical protein
MHVHKAMARGKGSWDPGAGVPSVFFQLDTCHFDLGLQEPPYLLPIPVIMLIMHLCVVQATKGLAST